MIITKLQGGLGNQLFQYATARHLQIARKCALIFDLSAYATDTLRTFDLDKLGIKNITITGIFAKILRKTLCTEIVQPGRSYDKNIFQEKGNLYLNGYWQCEEYFSGIKNILKHVIYTENKAHISGYRDFFKSNNRVAIHVRRQDYVSDPDVLNHHGSLGIDYYQKAVELINNKAVNPSYIVFSDDPDWVSSNLKFNADNVYYWRNNDAVNKNWHDFLLMASCDHFIIANSSYSWWAAWLAEGDKTLIIAPRKWFNDVPISSINVVPKRWMKI